MRIEDIAREAGVSSATVSRVLNRPDLVRADTREKVEAVIRAHEYIPDSLARGLASKQSKTIGVLIISISNAYYMEITEAIHKRLRNNGYMMLLGATDDSPDLEKRYARDFISRRVDGIIVIDVSNENFGSGFFSREAEKRPIVLVHSNASLRNSGIREVFLDQALGMRLALEHLWDLGHREVTFLRGRRGYSYDLKELVWEEWLRERGSSIRKGLVLRVDEPNTEEVVPLAEEAVREAIRRGTLRSALFCCNALQARGAITAITKAGLRIPQDVSIVSHDDTILATSGRVQLTAVDLRMDEVGRAAADLLLAALAGDDSVERSVYVAPTLEVRESSAPRKGPRAPRSP